MVCKWRITLVTCIILALLRTATSDASKTRVVYWHAWTQQWEQMVNHVVREFEASHPDIDVEPAIVSGNLIEKLVTAIAAGVAPDVITVYAGSNIPPLAAKGLLVPLPEMSRQQVANWVYPPFLDLGTWAGKVYGLSYWQQSTALVWRVSHLNEAGLDSERGPASLRELDEYARKLTKYDTQGNIVRMGFLPGHIEHWFSAFGGSLYESSAREITADRSENIRALEWMAEYRRILGLGKIRRWQANLASERAGINDPFVRGDMSMDIMGGAWKIGDWRTYGLPEDEWNLGPSPVVPPLEGTVTYTYGDFSVVPHTTKHPREAWEFVKFTAGATGDMEAYARVLFWGGRPINLPVSLQAYRSRAMTNVIREWSRYGKLINMVFDSKTRIASPPKTVVWPQYSAELGKATNRVLNGEAAASTALQEVTRMVQKLEDEYWASRAR